MRGSEYLVAEDTKREVGSSKEVAVEGVGTYAAAARLEDATPGRQRWPRHGTWAALRVRRGGVRRAGHWEGVGRIWVSHPAQLDMAQLWPI